MHTPNRITRFLGPPPSLPDHVDPFELINDLFDDGITIGAICRNHAISSRQLAAFCRSPFARAAAREVREANRFRQPFLEQDYRTWALEALKFICLDDYAPHADKRMAAAAILKFTCGIDSDETAPADEPEPASEEPPAKRPRNTRPRRVTNLRFTAEAEAPRQESPPATDHPEAKAGAPRTSPSNTVPPRRVSATNTPQSPPRGSGRHIPRPSATSSQSTPPARGSSPAATRPVTPGAARPTARDPPPPCLRASVPVPLKLLQPLSHQPPAMSELIILVMGLGLGAVLVVLALWAWKSRFGAMGRVTTTVRSNTVAQQVRRVGKLVGLEAQAKEITTSTHGWSWMPEMIVSRARIAMIFHFQKQYWTDLSSLTADDVLKVGPGRWRVRLPDVEGTLHINRITPYDIQAGRILGFVDVLPMNAERQRSLMDAAQEEAARVFEDSDRDYRNRARRSIERQVGAALGLMGIEAEFEWAGAEEGPERAEAPGPDDGRGEAGGGATPRLALTA